MSVQSLTTAPVNVYSKTFWTGFILAVSEEAAYELGLHDQINPEAVREPFERGWRSSKFTPNILQHIDFYSIFTDRSTKFDFSSRTVHEHHHHEAPARPLTEAERKKKEEESLNKYKYIGTGFGSLGAILAAITWRGYQRYRATYNYTEQVQKELKEKISQDLTPLKLELERIVAIKLKVDEIRFKILYRYFFASVAVLVGGALLALGGFSKDPRLINLGGIVLAVAAIWAAASAGFHLQDKKDIQELYKQIALDPHRLADRTLGSLQYYGEWMTPQPHVIQPSEPLPVPSAPPFLNIEHQEVFIAPRPSFGPGGYQVDLHYGEAVQVPFSYN